MPELPEVETVKRSLVACLVGQRCVAVGGRPVALRSPLDVARLRRHLVGAQVVAVRRRAKYLLVHLSPAPAPARAPPAAAVLLVHLGMSGRLRWQRLGAPRLLHDHAVLRFDNGFELCFHDPRRFGRLEVWAADEVDGHPSLASLGLEPLAPSPFDGAWLHAQSRHVRAPIKSFLMDARRLVGVGNIYASEALFAAGIHPQRAAGRLSMARCGRLSAAVREVLEDAIAHGGTTLRDFADATGSTGLFRPRLRVYGRALEACVRCRTPVRRTVSAGRSTFYCPGCQH